MIRFQEADHTYWLDHLRVPGISELLTYWGYIDPTVYRGTEARDIGTEVHKLTAKLEPAREMPEELPLEPEILLAFSPYNVDKILGSASAYMKFKTDKDFMSTSVEEICFSPTYNLACRLDRIGTFGPDGRAAIVELKCGAVQVWHRLQTAGHAVCAFPKSPALPRRFCLYLRGDGSYSLKEHNDLFDITAVQMLATLYWHNRNSGLRGKV